MNPKLASDRSPAKADGHSPLQVVAALKGSAEYGAWLEELAEHQRIRTVEMVELAVVHYAKHVGFDKPAPPRYPKR